MMSPRTEVFSIFRRVLRVSATFFVLALSACSLAVLANVPLNELAVAVTVPILWLFAISRILITATPAPPPDAKLVVKRTDILFAVAAWLLSGIAATDFFISGASFSRLGLTDLAAKSYSVAGVCGEACAGITLLIVLLAMQAVFGDLSDAMIVVVRKILMWPAGLADALSLPGIQKFQHDR